MDGCADQASPGNLPQHLLTPRQKLKMATGQPTNNITLTCCRTRRAPQCRTGHASPQRLFCSRFRWPGTAVGKACQAAHAAGRGSVPHARLRLLRGRVGSCQEGAECTTGAIGIGKCALLRKEGWKASQLVCVGCSLAGGVASLPANRPGPLRPSQGHSERGNTGLCSPAVMCSSYTPATRAV